MLSFENKFTQSPRAFLYENIDCRIKGLFHYHFFSNGMFGIRYKTKQPGITFDFGHVKTIKSNPNKSSTKTDFDIPNVHVCADFQIEKPSKFHFDIDINKIYNVISMSSSFCVEKGVLKEITLSPAIEDLDRRIRIQFTKSFSSKKEDKPLVLLIKNLTGFRSFELYKRGIEIINEERITNFKEYTGTNLIKLNLNSPNYFGFVTSHKFTLKAFRFKIENFLAFYKTPESLITFGFTENHKQIKNYHAAAITRLTDNYEVGVKFDSDDGHKKNHLQFGLSYIQNKSHFKFKINESLRSFCYYSYKVSDELKLSCCYNFSLKTSENSITSDEHLLLPFGIKLEIFN